MLKKIALATILLLMLSLSALNLGAPDILFKGVQDLTRAAAGLEHKQVKVGAFTYHYLDNENTDKPVILMVHGFTANKDNWARMAVFLKDDAHVIALDLLGHGDSPREMQADYKISSQTKRVKAFADALGLKQFHIAGSSMGGYIAGMYTAMYPEQILTTHLFDNAGVFMPHKSDMLVALENNEPHPLIIRSTDDVDRFFGYVFAQPPFMTHSIKQYYAEQSAVHAPLYEKIFSNFHGDAYYPEPLEPFLRQIKTPVQVIWGGADRVLHSSSIDTIKHVLPSVSVEVMPGIGHLPMLEKPKASALLLKNFL